MRKITTFLICLAIILSALLAPISFADGSQKADFAAEESFDTLSYSQSEYSQSMAVARATDESLLERTAKAFLASARASVRAPQLYDCRAFISSTGIESSVVAYRLSEVEYLTKLYEALDWVITSDNIAFSNYKCTIEDNRAEISIVEDYTYFITDGFDDESFRRREYYFTLQKDTNGWTILSVTTNDPWELETSFEYVAINVDEAIQNILFEMEQTAGNSRNNNAELADTSNNEAAVAATSLLRWTYSPSLAVAYAANHYADTNNDVFGFTAGNNCQNFASQCVWAGLGGSGSSTTDFPAVAKALVGETARNVWERNADITLYASDYYWLNWTWDNVRGFANMISTSTGTSIGPYGYVEHTGGFAYAEVGDILIVDWEGAPARDTLDHAMFVTQVSGTSGSRTKSNIKIAAHTNATNSAYQTVESYTSVPTSYFARVVIQGGYYTEPQP